MNDIGSGEGVMLVGEKERFWQGEIWKAVAVQRRGGKGLCNLGTPVEGRDE